LVMRMQNVSQTAAAAYPPITSLRKWTPQVDSAEPDKQNEACKECNRRPAGKMA
jgi:hypothetical protein